MPSTRSGARRGNGSQQERRPGDAVPGPFHHPTNARVFSAAPAASPARTAARPPAAVAPWAPAAGPTLGLRARLVHDQVAIAEEPPVEHLDRLRRLLFRRHLHEAEPAWTAGELVGDD